MSNEGRTSEDTSPDETPSSVTAISEKAKLVILRASKVFVSRCKRWEAGRSGGKDADVSRNDADEEVARRSAEGN